MALNDNACGIALNPDVGIFLPLFAPFRDDAWPVFDKVSVPEELAGLDGGIEMLIVREAIEMALCPGCVADEFAPLVCVDRSLCVLLDVGEDFVFLLFQKFKRAVHRDGRARNGGGLGTRGDLAPGVDILAGLWDTSGVERIRVSVGGFASTGANGQFSRQSFFVSKLHIIGSVPVYIFLDGDERHELLAFEGKAMGEVDEAEPFFGVLAT